MTCSAAQAGGGARFVLRTSTQADDPDRLWLDAGIDAAGAASTTLAALFIGMAALVATTRWQLDRNRYHQWDIELERILVDAGGRANGTEFGRAP